MKCRRCDLDKPQEAMQINRSRKSGFSGYCKTCSAEITRAWQKANPEKARASNKRWLNEHRDHVKRRRRRYQKIRLPKIRAAALKILGGACVKCGMSDLRVLQIDHIKGGGAIERRRLGPLSLYQKVIRTSGAGYQILCANCNWIKRAEDPFVPGNL